MSSLRVGVDLCRIDPATPSPADHAILDTLEAERRAPVEDIPSVRGIDEPVAPAPRPVTPAPAPTTKKSGEYDADNLEIPSFLRRR